MGLSNWGEELLVKNGITGTDVEVLLYNDATDQMGDTDDVGAVTTEPNDGNYARQNATITDAEIASFGGNWGFEFEVEFDVTDTTGQVDSAGVLSSFTAEESGDGGATLHVISTHPTPATRDLSQIETYTVTVRGTLD